MIGKMKNTEKQSLIHGHDNTGQIVAVEWSSLNDGQDAIQYFVRQKQDTIVESVPFHPWLWIEREELLDGCDGIVELIALAGQGVLNRLVIFENWKKLQAALKVLKAKTGKTASALDAPYYCINDPVQQYLMFSGQTLFKNMAFSQLKRMQIDIETYTEEGFDFCNASRSGDRITAIAMADNSGWTMVLDGAKLDEKTLLEEMVQYIAERDPDTIEGHNIFNFDWPYITIRAKKCGVKLAVGRDGSVPKSRPSRFNVAERTIQFTRAHIHGRHIIDTYFLVQLYDVTSRSLQSFGLKNVAKHFGIAAPERTYIDGSELAEMFTRDPDLLMRYAQDDIIETRSLAGLLSPVYFAQAQMLPFSYQNICVRGNATKIDALMLREYLHQRQAIPRPEATQKIAGGYTDLFFQGVALNVQHCDVRSLYPSLMINRKLTPASDELGVFLDLLVYLREQRFDFKDRMHAAGTQEERTYCDAVQSCLKILINSFYGYLAFAQGHFNDYDVAGQITLGGRTLLKEMIETISSMGGRPIEIDTDGIYFIPPAEDKILQTTFRSRFIETLPEGIEIEFDGDYSSMFSYKMKNYALLEGDGKMIVKGAALKSRGLERFQRDYLRAYLRLKLEQKEMDIPALKQHYATAIRERQWPIEMLAKTETLQKAPASYAEKIESGARGRNAAYELALKSTRKYRAGDQLSYYVTGTVKTVAVYSAAKLTSDWDPDNRDENVAYYLNKLQKLFEKFGQETVQQELF